MKMVKANIFIKNSSDYTDEFKNKVFNLLNDYHKDKINIKKSRIISYCMIYEYLILNSNLNINDIYYSNNGKPLLDGVYFSLSNKDDLTVLAVSRYTIGVDIERITDYDFLIVKNFFNEEEKNIVKNSDFFRIFTLKESYIKMFDLKYDSFYKDDYNKYYNETIEYNDYIISYVVDCLK